MDRFVRFVISGIESVRAEVPDEPALSRLCERIRHSRDIRDVEGFAFRVGRNWAIAQWRHETAMRHKEELAAFRQEDQERKKREKERREADRLLARDQYLLIRDRLDPCLVSNQEYHLMLVWLIHLNGYTHEQAVNFLPQGITLNTRHQWLRRGEKLLLRHNPPPELRRVLSWRAPRNQ